MTTMNISLPEQMREWIDAQVKSGSFGNASEYIRSLIRDDQKQRAHEELEAKLIEGLESGPATPWTKQDAEMIKARILARTAQAQKKG